MESLPDEILLQVFSHIPRTSIRDLKWWAQTMKVNKTFYRVTRPILYRTLDFTRGSKTQKHKLISTLLDFPETLSVVRKIVYDTDTFTVSENAMQLDDDIASRLWAAFGAAHAFSPSFQGRLRQDLPSLTLVDAMALVFVMCPGLNILDITDEDPINSTLGRLIRELMSQYSSTGQVTAPALGSIKGMKLDVYTEFSDMNSGASRDISEISHYFGFPSLQEMTCSWVTSRSALTYVFPTNLSLRVLRLDSCSVRAQVLGQLLAACPNIRELHLEYDDDDDGVPPSNRYRLELRALGHVLRQQGSRIQVLTILTSPLSQPDEVLGRLNTMGQLRRLVVPRLALIGHQDGGPEWTSGTRHPNYLVESLPRSLQELIVTDFPPQEERAGFLQIQLEEMKKNENFPHLRQWGTHDSQPFSRDLVLYQSGYGYMWAPYTWFYVGNGDPADAAHFRQIYSSIGVPAEYEDRD